MALSLAKDAAISTGVGVLDLALDYVDATQNLQLPFQNTHDWGRALGTVGGYALAYLRDGKTSGEVGRVVAIAYEPLLLRTLYRLVRGRWPIGLGGPEGSIHLVRAGQGFGSIVPPPQAPPAQVSPRQYRSFVP